MPIAVNDSGEAVFLNPQGQWEPAKIAVNPQTNEKLAFDGSNWQPLSSSIDKGITLDDLVRSAAQGIPIVGALADKFAAGMDALTQPVLGRGSDAPSISERYTKNIAAEKARTEAFNRNHPIASTVAGIAGAVAATIPLAATGVGAKILGLTGKTLPAQVGQGILSGGTIGGIDSALRGGDFTTGATVGGIVGGAAPLAGRAIGKGIEGIRGAFSPEANVAADLGRALVRDDTTPEALLKRVNDLRGVRPMMANIADAGGENVRGLVERVAQTPGAGRTKVVPAITARQQGQAMRLSNDLSSLAGTSRTAFRAINETAAEQARAATPLYQAAYEAGDRAIWSPELERLSTSPTVQRAMRGAVRTWQDVAVADGFGGMNPGAMVQNGQLSFLNGRVPAFPNLQFWDYTKRILDDQVSSALRSGENQKARTLTTLTRMLRNELYKHVPEFEAANNAWAGPARFLDAIEEGRNIVSSKIGPEEFAARLADMGNAEKEALRIGAVSSIVGKMGNDASALGDMTKYLRSPAMRAKIAAIMPNEEAAKAWQRRLEFEISSSQLTGQALKNSATARRLAERQDAENLVGDLVLDAISGGSTMGMFRRVVSAAPRWLRDTLRSKADAQLADVLINPQRAATLQDVLAKIGQSTTRSQNINRNLTLGIRAGGQSLIGAQ